MRTLGLVCIFLCLQAVKAQTISFTAGNSIPFGTYASKDFTQSVAGMAIKGRAYSLMLEDNRRTKMLSPFLQLTYNTNEVDENALNGVYKYIGYRGTQTYKPWTQTLLMGGARFTYSTDHYELFAKTGLGMGWLSTYGYNIYSDSNGVIKFNVLKVNTLTTTAGVGAVIYLKPYISLLLGSDFFYAKVNYGYEKYTNANGPVKAAVAVEVKAPLQMMNLYMGLRFQLAGPPKKK